MARTVGIGKQDFEKMKEMGAEAYNYRQMQKLEILKLLLKDYNDGRKKSFFVELHRK